MNFESFYWKKHLKRDVSFILKKMDINLDKLENEEQIEQILSTIEIKLFIIAFSLRKLIDTNKISDKLSNIKIKTIVYSKNSKGITLLNRHRFDEHYDFDKKTEKRIKIRDICNQIIHSYIFQLSSYRGKIFYIFINSDKNKNKYLFHLKIKDFLKIVIKFSLNYPAQISKIYCSKLQDYKVSSK